MRKFRFDINYKKENGEYVGFVSRISMRRLFWWVTIVEIVDDDLDYLENRSVEIVEMLENPAR